jgi:UDP-N-acetylmuramoyl-L-alanyl-D-glutamate--2,6-diaminopimelate ligase
MNPKRLVRKIIPASQIRLVESAYRKSRLGLAHARYGFPARNLKIIAVTGTNGKTTTCSFINEMLKSSGHTTAMLTTAEIEMDGKRTANKLHRTVPLTSDLFRFLKQAADKKVDYVIFEATSQALHQHKLWGLPIEVAVMTNLTQDHLDYHGSMENYAAVKARLFNGYMKPKACVLNADDEWYAYFKKQSVGTVSRYGQAKEADMQISGIKLAADGTDLELSFKNENLPLHTSLIGKFNAYNAAAAASTGLVLGLSKSDVIKGIASLKAVPGRMEAVDEGQDFGVIVDYAHSADALKNVLGTLQEVSEGKVIAVFGATGDRDASKRPIMGQVAAENADYIVLTDDETYSEDGAVIRKAVYEGIVKAGGANKTKEVGDREEAIKTAFEMAKKGDVVLLAGLGHQDYRAMKEGKETWDDREVARKQLKL